MRVRKHPLFLFDFYLNYDIIIIEISKGYDNIPIDAIDEINAFIQE